jgi:hypothetical protein
MSAHDNYSLLMNALFESTMFGSNRFLFYPKEARQKLTSMMNQQLKFIKEAESYDQQLNDYFRNQYKPLHPKLFTFDPDYM